MNLRTLVPTSLSWPDYSYQRICQQSPGTERAAAQEDWSWGALLGSIIGRPVARHA